LTAIEVLISLVILSMVSVFSLHALEYSRRIYLETEQVDYSRQLAQDILNQLMEGENWKEVRSKWEAEHFHAYGTDFHIQFEGENGEQKGITDLELTISWISPRGLKQQAFNTSVFDWEVAP